MHETCINEEVCLQSFEGGERTEQATRQFCDGIVVQVPAPRVQIR